MGQLRGRSTEDAARALIGHAHDLAARKEEGALLGALLMVRQGQDLHQRVRTMLDGLSAKPIAELKQRSLRDVYTMIAAMHAANQLYLTRRVLARALGCEQAELERHALNPLRLEAMLDGGETHLLTRHRRIAEVAIMVMEEDQDPYRWLPLLARAGRKDFLQTREDRYVKEWTFTLAQSFTKDEKRWPVARAIAKAVHEAEPESYHSITACSRIHRETEASDAAFRILLATGERFRKRRDVLYEWGTVAGKLGEYGLNVWLVARSLADGTTELSSEQCKLSLAGLGAAFGGLYTTQGDRRFLTAQTACGQLGLDLPGIDPTTLGYFQKHKAAGQRAGIKDLPLDAAIKAIAEAVPLAVDEVEYRADSEEHPPIDPVFFERLLGDPADYRFKKLQRVLMPAAAVPSAVKGKAR